MLINNWLYGDNAVTGETAVNYGVISVLVWLETSSLCSESVSYLKPGQICHSLLIINDLKNPAQMYCF